MDFLSGLNPQQREAVETTDGPVLILAGAGSGKTRVITHRIAYLIATRHVPATALVAVTFTNKAAAEMRSRVENLLEGFPLAAPPLISTFHSFCVRLLRRDGDGLAAVRPGFTRTFSIYDDDDQLLLIKAAYKRMGLDEKAMPYRATLSQISHAKNLKKTPQEMYNESGDPRVTKIAAVYEEYEKELRQANALDFDDLLLEAVRLLWHDAPTRLRWNERLSYVMIDEYQDTNRSQYELMRLLSQRHDNVCVVGDEDQSIYSWRGADIRNILDFEKDFPRAKTIRLEQNYRSTKNILEAASVVVANNKERKGKWLWTEADEGDMIAIYTAHDAENEALYVADSIDRIVRQYPDRRVAVLYRTNSQSRQIEEALRRYNRKYNVVGGISYYQRQEVRDILAYLRLALTEGDANSLQRIINVPARGIGKTTVEQAEKFAAENGLGLWQAVGKMLERGAFGTRANAAVGSFLRMMDEIGEAVRKQPLNEALRFIEDRTGYRRVLEEENTPESQARIENLNELMNAAAEAVERGETASEFLDHAALVAQADALDERSQITLMTIHNAKGLEFPVVFMAGMEDGLFPHSRSLLSEAAMEEERRLCYVGMTRAEKRLVMTWARYRRRFGGGEQERTLPSRFLKEVPENLVVRIGVEEDDGTPQVELTAERWQVRQESRKNLYTGKTYNSVENVAQFFRDRGIPTRQPVQQPAPPPPPPPPAAGPAAPPPVRPAAVAPPRAPISPQRGLFGDSPVPPVQRTAPLPKAPPPPRQPQRTGTLVEHPKYGTGTIVRREGEGDDAKVVVIFQRYGMKKLVEKYAGLKNA